MDAARSCVAMGPLAIYLFVLGYINLSPRPFVTNWLRDLAALALAASGLVMVGPVELFMPTAVIVNMGVWFWLAALGFYASCVTLVLLFLPPRVIVYNIGANELRRALSEIAPRLDPQAQWVGESLAMPNLGLSLYLKSFRPLRNVSLIPVGQSPSLESWRLLETALRSGLRDVRVTPNPRGLTMVLIAGFISVVLVARWVSDPQEVAQGLIEMLGL